MTLSDYSHMGSVQRLSCNDEYLSSDGEVRGDLLSIECINILMDNGNIDIVRSL